MAETFELTPEQWTKLMERLGGNYGAYDDLVSHTEGGRTFSRTYIVGGQSEAELLSRGMRAVARGGQGALASVEARYAPGALSPSSFSVTTEDPAILAELRGIRAQASVTESFQRMLEAMKRIMGRPELREREFQDSLQEMRGLRERMMGSSEAIERAAPDGQTSGRDRILDEVSRALEGTAFSVQSGPDLDSLGQRAREMDPGIMRESGPSTAIPMPTVRAPTTGMMRYMEPDGTSSVFSGDRRLYTDIQIFERHAFHRGSLRAAGTLRIYGDLSRPHRHEIITDNPALRAAAERAGIPVRGASEQAPRELERPRPPR